MRALLSGLAKSIYQILVLSHRLRKWHKFPGPVKEHGKAKPQQSPTFFDTQSKTSLTTITNPLFLWDDATKNMSNPLGSHARTTENTAYHHTKCYIQKLLTNTIRNSLGQKHPDFAHLWVMRLNVCFLNYTCKKKPTIVNVKISGLTCDFRCNPTTLPHNQQFYQEIFRCHCFQTLVFCPFKRKMYSSLDFIT